MDTNTEVDRQDAVAEVDKTFRTVQHPDRALETYRSEANGAMVRNLGCGLVALIVLPLMALFAFAIDQSSQGDSFLGNIFGIVGLIATPLVVIFFIAEAISARKEGLSVPDRSTPEATLHAFLNAIEKGLWQRAYNCLTDVAQTQSVPHRVWEDDLQNKIPDLQITSLASFKKFWKGIKFTYQPQWGRLEMVAIDDETAELTLPMMAKWKEDHRGNSKEVQRSFVTKFIAVRQGDFWFLISGCL